MHPIDIYTDGGCHGNPGPGAWAFVVDNPSFEQSGAEPATTNNRMELQAVIEALKYAERLSADGIRLHTDSQYVNNGITSWIKSWVRNGWRTASKKPVKNRDLWELLHELDTRLHPEWRWVRGHAGDELNERCDRLVQDRIGELET